MNPLELVPAFLQNLGCSGRILVPLLKNHVSHVTAFQELPRASQCGRPEAFYVELHHVYPLVSQSVIEPHDGHLETSFAAF